MLVVVSGAPGSGKPTLARSLSREIGLLLLSRDRLKEVLLDALGAADRAASPEIGRASFALLFEVAGTLLDASVGVIVESNFRRGVSEPELRALTVKAPTVLLHCQTRHDETVHRYAERAARIERHAGHFDSEAISELLRDSKRGATNRLNSTCQRSRSTRR